MRFVEADIGRFDGQVACFGHRVARVDRQVQDGVLELICVGKSGPKIGSQEACELDMLAQGATQHVLHVRDQSVYIVGSIIQRLPPRKCRKRKPNPAFSRRF
jgi:hypothetical protein